MSAAQTGWIGRLGGTGDSGLEEVARAIDFDGAGAAIVVGTLGPQANLSSSAGAAANALSAGGGTDGFVAAMEADGRLRWAQSFGGNGEDYAYDVVVGRDDSAWVCGTFTGTAWFGSTRLVAQGANANGFAFRVTPSGSIDHVVHIGSASGVIPGECAVDDTGRLYVTGSYAGAPTFSGIALPAAPQGQTAAFVAAYEADGRFRWVRGLRASVGAAWRGIAIAADGSGDVLGIGQFRGSMTVGNVTLNAGTAAAGSWIGRWRADGTPRWALAPAGESYGRGISADGGEIVVSGSFRGDLQWPGLTTTRSAGGQDLYAARLTATGTPRWSRAIGGGADDEGAEIAVDGGGIYLGGAFGGSATVGGSQLRSAGARDILIAHLDRSGNPIGARAIGGSGDDVGYALEVSPGGWVAYAGFGRGSVADGERNIAAQGGHDAVFGVVGSASAPMLSPLATAFASNAVTIPQRGGGTLSARIYAPDSGSGRYPAISLLPGGGAPIDSVFWAAEGLAARGYVVIVTQPSSGGSLSAYHTAAVSGIDYLRSSANPYAAITDGEKIGVAGWSLGARALSRTQEEDTRVDALVAWDNLAVIESGDVGSPNCRGTVPSSRRTPRVPAMGQASDYCGPPNETVEDKKYAYEWWRSRAQPTMQVVLANSDHFVWGTQGNGSAKQGYALYYTAAWFDRWLKNDSSATNRLLARTVNGQSVGTVLSTRFRSAASFDGVNCPNFRSSCP